MRLIIIYIINKGLHGQSRYALPELINNEFKSPKACMGTLIILGCEYYMTDGLAQDHIQWHMHYELCTEIIIHMIWILKETPRLN